MEFEMEMQEVAIIHRNDEHVVSMTQVYSGVKNTDRSDCLCICPCRYRKTRSRSRREYSLDKSSQANVDRVIREVLNSG